MAYDFSTVSVLIVEDNQPILELTKSLLSTFGMNRIFTAKDGREGYKTFCQEIPDLVISDLVMSPMDGLQLAEKIRKDALSPNPYVPIILITAFSEKERIIAARDQGITEFLVKPFNARDLYRRIAQVIENPRKFVRAQDFFGPDRRRKKNAGYHGPYRRSTDVSEEDYQNWKAQQFMRTSDIKDEG